jgi:hypothetical protein
MPTLVRYSNFKSLKRGDIPKKAAKPSSVDQITELEDFLKLLSKKNGRSKAKKL